MKRIMFTICFLITISAWAYAAEFQKCIDKDGNSFLTNSPPPGAKCESTGIEIIQSTPQNGRDLQKEEMSKKEISGDEEIISKKAQNCINNCKEQKQIFLNINQDLRLGEALFEECIAKCPSEEKSAPDMSDGLIQSDKQLKVN